MYNKRILQNPNRKFWAEYVVIAWFVRNAAGIMGETPKLSRKYVNEGWWFEFEPSTVWPDWIVKSS